MITAPTFVTVDEVKTHLRKTASTDDAALAGFISAACQMIVDRIGDVSSVDVTEVSRACRHTRRIILDRRPVLTITSVVEVRTGDTIPAADPANSVDGWQLDDGAGVLSHTVFWPVGDIRVTYSAGRDPVPGNIRLAALELTGHLWKQSQLNNGGGRPPITGDDQVIVPGAAYALPLRVRELLGLGKNPTSDVLVG